MTSDELKKLLEARAIIDTPNICNSCYAEGFRNAFDIMWPLIEALEFYKDIQKNHSFIFDNEQSSRAQIYEKYKEYSIGDVGVLAHKTLLDLEQKLKGTE